MSAIWQMCQQMFLVRIFPLKLFFELKGIKNYRLLNRPQSAPEE